MDHPMIPILQQAIQLYEQMKLIPKLQLQYYEMNIDAAKLQLKMLGVDVDE